MPRLIRGLTENNMPAKLEATIILRNEQGEPEQVVIQNKDRHWIFYGVDESGDEDIIKLVNKEK